MLGMCVMHNYLGVPGQWHGTASAFKECQSSTHGCRSESTGRGLVGEGAVVDFAGGGVVHMVSSRLGELLWLFSPASATVC